VQYRPGIHHIIKQDTRFGLFAPHVERPHRRAVEVAGYSPLDTGERQRHHGLQERGAEVDLVERAERFEGKVHDSLSPIARSGAPTDIGVVSHPRSSRQRYRGFVEDYKHRRLDDSVASGNTSQNGKAPDAAATERRGKRRQYVREYLRWLRPYRYAVVGLFLLALVTTGLQMIEPLFMRFIIDRVLLNRELDAPARLTRLNLAGGLFVVVIVLSNLVNLTKDYRQRLLNVKVMLSLRRAMFERLLHLPLPKLWDMKTGGILSRLTGDVDTTTGLMQMALVSPAISVIRLIIAIGH